MKQRYLFKEHVFGFLLGGTGSCISFPYLCNKLSPNWVASQAYQVSASRFPTRLQSRYSCGLIPRHNLGGSASQLTHSWYIHRVDYWTAGLSSGFYISSCHLWSGLSRSEQYISVEYFSKCLLKE